MPGTHRGRPNFSSYPRRLCGLCVSAVNRAWKDSPQRRRERKGKRREFQSATLGTHLLSLYLVNPVNHVQLFFSCAP
jgi:hypothetical protein